jgi:hypothetical protein
VTVGTGSAHSAAIGVVNGFAVLLVNVFFHLVAGDTKFQCIGSLHGRIETAPENNPDDHEEQGSAEGCSQHNLARHYSEFSRRFSHLLSHLVVLVILKKSLETFTK